VLWTPPTRQFQKFVSSHGASRPSTTLGASVTPGDDTYGSYATVLAGASVTDDVYGIVLNVNSAATSGSRKDCLVTIGVDAAGGTSFSTLIPDLLCCDAGSYPAGCWYFFPLFIKSGTSIGAKASVNNATVGTVNVNVILLCNPRRPESIRCGTKVAALGAIDGSNSVGVAITSGTTGEGAWTGLGATLSDDCWFFGLGWDVNSAAMAALSYHVDFAIGDGSNKLVVIQDMLVNTTAAEAAHKGPNFCYGYAEGQAGTTPYVRMQCSGTPDSSLTMMAYGVSG
jgi:hypothetical protein